MSYLSIIEYIKSEISILKKVANLSQNIIEGACPPSTKLLRNGLNVTDRPKHVHRDHYPAVVNKCMGSLRSHDRGSRD